MPRLALKPDASFYQYIAQGVIGARAVATDLEGHGHQVIELERGATDTKIWKEVKRKRVRIPDLLCTRCARRIECRTKTKPDLSMSHSSTDAERAWDYGMVDEDWVAFPVCRPFDGCDWTSGRLRGCGSYWHERIWTKWRAVGAISYFAVRDLRSVPPDATSTKGVTEGSETTIAWKAIFSTRTGAVDAVDGQKVRVSRASDGHRYTWTAKPRQTVQVTAGEPVQTGQLLAGAVPAVAGIHLDCGGAFSADQLGRLLRSRERTQRFTGVKLARVLEASGELDAIGEIADDHEEDMYVRLESLSYLATVGGRPARELFVPVLKKADQQTRLEAVIALGETATHDATELLGEILHSPHQPEFMRSAAAWSLGKVASDGAQQLLVSAFSHVSHAVREEALEAMVGLEKSAMDALLRGLRQEDENVAAGCAEALRQCHGLDDDAVEQLLGEVAEGECGAIPSRWIVWLLGHVPLDPLAPAIANLQDSRPDLHYALSVLWGFVNSWISKRWELRPSPPQ